MVDAYSLAKLVHLLAATVWIGGHIVIALGYLPRLPRGGFEDLDRFEAVYEKIALPCFALAVATGVYMGLHWYPLDAWLKPVGKSWVLGAKAVLVILTVLLALDARLRIIRRSRLQGVKPNPVDLALHVLGVTGAAIGFLVLGWMLRLA